MCKKIEHTPGPWAASSRTPWTPKSRYFDIRSLHPDHITDGVGSYVAANVFGEADAVAIAALPDLLETAEGVLADLEHYVSTHGPGPDVRLKALKAAIAKAKGGTHA